MKKIIEVSPYDRLERIDKFISAKTGITRSRVQKSIESALVEVGGAPVKSNYKIRPGDRITLRVPDEEPPALVPEDLPLNILHLDGHLIVVDKPAGMVVYPAAGHAGGTLMNAVSFHAGRLASVGGPLRPGVVHRLDKDTSGVMVVALDDDTYYGLVEQFKKRAVKRSYVALVLGGPKRDRGRISFLIGRSEADRKKMSVRSRRGKEALTSWEVIERLSGASVIRARLATGRTHQIRVHFSAIGHPVLGDRTYGKKTSLELRSPKTGVKKRVMFNRQMLHAEALGFVHPETGKHLEFKTSMPGDMSEALNELRKLI